MGGFVVTFLGIYAMEIMTIFAVLLLLDEFSILPFAMHIKEFVVIFFCEHACSCHLFHSKYLHYLIARILNTRCFFIIIEESLSW